MRNNHRRYNALIIFVIVAFIFTSFPFEIIIDPTIIISKYCELREDLNQPEKYNTDNDVDSKKVIPVCFILHNKLQDEDICKFLSINYFTFNHSSKNADICIVNSTLRI